MTKLHYISSPTTNPNPKPSTMSTLPPEIISYILRQLPVKSLLRFRCTSKPWCSLIDDPQFTKLHLNHSIHTNSNQRLLLKSPQLCSVNLDLLDRAVEIDHPLKSREDNTQAGVLGSCNGLLCLCNSDEEIVLFNLSTGKHFKLPESGLISQDKAVAHNMIVHSTAGFGYDSVHEDYKLLRIVQFRHTFDSEVMLYSLKSNSWKRVSCFPYGLPIDKTTGVFASGALHWIVAPKGLMDRLFLIAFDLATEEYREVPEPFYGSDWDYFLELGVLEGRICVVCNHVRKCSDFWVMNDYGVKESWAKLLSIAQPQLTSSFDCFKPVVYLHNRNGVVLIQDDKKLLSYDLKTNNVKRVGVRGVPVSFDALPYVESLVNPMPMATGSGGDGPVGKQGKGRNRNVAKKRNDFLSKGFKLVL